MPNELGLFSKQEAKNIRDIAAIQGSGKLFQIAEVIRQCQMQSPLQTSITFNEVVHDDVFKYFKNTVGYDVLEDKTGQPVNFTKILTISWFL